MYIVDTCSFEKMFQFYPNRFRILWNNINRLTQEGKLLSVYEVYKELNRGLAVKWKEDNKKIFPKVSEEEAEFIKEIFKAENGHFQSCIRNTQLLKGSPVADPFVIASAKVRSATVVTEESYKPKSSKIPNICEFFSIPCITFEGVMEREGWEF